MADLANAELVKKFKNRIHIFHSIQDADFDEWITASIQAIQDRTGFTKTDDPRFVELVIERCRYRYNDSLEYFDQNYQGDLLSLSLSNYEADTNQESGGDTDVDKTNI